MKDLENNKIVAAILVAGLIALATGKIADGLYHPVHEVEKRGFAVEVPEEGSSEMQVAEEEVPINIAELMAAADAEAGAKGFKKCAACHSVEPGVNKVGPSLAGIVNHDIAGVAGYSYSNALLEKDGSWDIDNLAAFLKKPKDFAKGTKMTFAGIKKPEQIADIIAFLKTK